MRACPRCQRLFPYSPNSFMRYCVSCTSDPSAHIRVIRWCRPSTPNAPDWFVRSIADRTASACIFFAHQRPTHRLSARRTCRRCRRTAEFICKHLPDAANTLLEWGRGTLNPLPGCRVVRRLRVNNGKSVATGDESTGQNGTGRDGTRRMAEIIQLEICLAGVRAGVRTLAMRHTRCTRV